MSDWVPIRHHKSTGESYPANLAGKPFSSGLPFRAMGSRLIHMKYDSLKMMEVLRRGFCAGFRTLVAEVSRPEWNMLHRLSPSSRLDHLLRLLAEFCLGPGSPRDKRP